MQPTKKLYRNKQEGKILGVAAGLADYFKVDVTLVRVLWVIAIFGYGSGVLAYLLAALIMPVRPIDTPPLGKE